MLRIIFGRQRNLMAKYEGIEESNGLLQTHDIPVDLNSAKGQARLKDFAWRVTEELGEAMNCLKNKPWKQSQMLTDIDHYLEEIADAFHFFVELCILSGIDAEKLYDLYFRKSEVNHFRQRSNY
ncbi:MAG: hypothetical protein KGL39_16390 [Patescibacteria group bacterium]|nr:hypothetical protein [Patescibacteria group bacterium]